MRLMHPDGTIVHLAYCTNVHPAEDLPGVLRQLDQYAEPVRERLEAPRLGLGLWLAHDAARALVDDPPALTRLRNALTARGLEVVTLNGFPHRGFHEPVVKHAVYRPDWTDPARLHHTLDLARLLAFLLPSDAARGSISSLPLGWRTPWTPDHETAALRNLDLLAEGLAKIEAETGRTIRVGLEPEPGCTIGTVGDACARLGGIDTERVGICLDTCHLAVDFEQPDQVRATLAKAGLPVVKAQVSCALQADDPSDPAVRAALADFAEPRFLHQTRSGTAPRPQGWDELDTALRTDPREHDKPWRVHFHIPLHADPEPPLSSTRPVLTDALRVLTQAPLTDHLEVETYTWSVLPAAARPADRPALIDGIAAELSWTRRQLLALGLRDAS
jgi:hypothetical protein